METNDILHRFNSEYSRYIDNGMFLESSDYYKRYKSRYYIIMKTILSLNLPLNSKILEIGGGQNAILANKMFSVDATVGDVSDSYRSYVEKLGVGFVKYDLVKDGPFCTDRYDVIIISEVIEHIPVPPYIVLCKIREMLCDGGALILTTPNLYSIRNIVYLALGMQMFGKFFYPDEDEFCREHILEYSRDHLSWQLRKAGFSCIHIDFCQFHHRPNKLLFRTLYWIGRPMFIVSRFRQNLLAVAKK